MNVKNTINASCEVCCPEAEAARRVGLSRIEEINLPSRWEQRELRLAFVKSESSGFSLEIRGNEVVIQAGMTREFLTGVGYLLSRIRSAADDSARLSDGIYEEIPENPVRIHYMPGHFGNAFEVAWPREMGRYFEDLALWGAGAVFDERRDQQNPDYAPSFMVISFFYRIGRCSSVQHPTHTVQIGA